MSLLDIPRDTWVNHIVPYLSITAHPLRFVSKNFRGYVHAGLKVHAFDWGPNFCAYAASLEKTDLLHWAYALGCAWDGRVCSELAKRGDVGTIIWAREVGCRWSNDVYVAAASHGQKEVIRWASSRYSFPYVALEAAFAHGQEDLVCWLMQEKIVDIKNKGNLWHVVALNARLKMAELLYEHGVPFAWDTIEYAIASGSLEMCKWLDEKHQTPTSRGSYRAIRSLNIEVLKWALSRGAYIQNRDIDYAAKKGGLQMMKYLREELKLPWSSDTFKLIIESKDPELISYAKENGCFFGQRECALAIQMEFLDLAKYFLENGSVVDDDILECAISLNDSKFFKDLYKIGKLESFKEFSETVFYLATEIGNKDIIKFAREHECPWDDEWMVFS